MEYPGVKDSVVVCETSQGLELRGSLVRLGRHQVIFEVYNPISVLQTSEVLAQFRIFFKDRTAYSGKAVINNLIHTGLIVLCEVTLEEGWQDVEFISSPDQLPRLREQFDGHIRDWQKFYRVLPEYKVHIADMHSFFTELRQWLDQVELGIRAAPSGDRLELEQQTAFALASSILPCIDHLFQKFESIAAAIEPEARSLHANYMRRQLHPLVLAAPFAYRTFVKPLGYAGDYEMVNMILRNGCEGSSLFAKVIHRWFVQQAPAEAHRNRIDLLTQRLVEETLRGQREGHRARVFCLACGPAMELQRFLREKDISDRAELTLLDFNEETLQHTNGLLSDLKARHQRVTPVHLIKKSVYNILKESGKSVERAPEAQFDFVYCAGLFDYLPDQVCQRLMGICYQWLAPGGLLLSTNVEPSNPQRHGMEHLLDWHLIYRTGPQCQTLRPSSCLPDHYSVKADITGVNLFMEARKPKNGQ